LEYLYVGTPAGLPDFSEEQLNLLFDQIDLSKDGVIDKQELETFYAVSYDKMREEVTKNVQEKMTQQYE
jgi:Ca2+-binding EF-hand superfamily protein